MVTFGYSLGEVVEVTFWQSLGEMVEVTFWQSLGEVVEVTFWQSLGEVVEVFLFCFGKGLEKWLKLLCQMTLHYIKNTLKGGL